MALQLQTVVPGAPPQRTALGAGRTRVPARPGTRYQLLDDAGQIPAGVTIKRIENGVVIDGLPGDRSVEITDFFTACGPDSATTCEISTAELGGKAPITPSSDPLGALSDGSFLLYGGGSQSGAQGLAAPIIAATDNSWKAIGAGLGGIAIAGLAVGGGGGKGETPDTVAPAPPTITNKAAQNSATPTFTGNGEPNSTVLLRIDVDGNGKIDGSDPTFQVSVGADGTWTLPLAGNAPVLGSWSGALPDGNYIVVAVARDAAGNISQPSSTTVAIDTKVPATPTIDLIAGDGTVSGAEAAAGVVVTGTGEAGTSIRITWGSVSKTGTVGADGKWDFLFGPTEIPAQQGSSLVQVTLTDAAGNVSAEGLRPAQIATAPAAPTIDIVAGDGVVSGAEAAAGVAVSGSGESGATVSVTWGSTVKTSSVAADGSWSVLFGTAEIPVTQGASLVQTTLSNATGNVSPTLSRVVIIDTQGPAAPVIANGPLTNLALPTFSGSAEANAKVRVSVDLAGNGSVDAIYETTASAAGSWSVNTQAPAAGTTLVSGSMGAGFADKVGVTLVQNTVAAVAIDAAGNTGVVATTSIARDASIPAAPVINTVAGDNTVNFAERGTIIITGSLPADSAGQPVTVTWGGIAKTVTATAQTFSVAFTVGEIPPDGAAPVTAVSQSATGVQGVVGTLAVSVDSVAPAAPAAPAVVEGAGGLNAAEASDGTAVVVSLAGTGAVAGDTIRVNWGGQATTRPLTGVEVGAGSASVAIGAGAISTQGDGLVAVTVTITDVAGNVSATSTATSVTVDTAGPAQTLSSVSVTDNAPLTTGAIAHNGLSNDATPTVTIVLGSALLAGETLSLFRDAGTTAVATATVGATTLAFTEPSTLADGTRTYRATLTDSVGNTRTLDLNGAVTGTTFSFLLDATPPAAPLGTPDLAPASDTGFSSTDNVTTDTTPTFVVGALASDAILYVNGTAVAATYNSGGGGTLTVDPGDALAPSAIPRTFTFAWTDGSGNVSVQSPGLQVTVDVAGGPPAAPTTAPDLLAASDSGVSTTDNVTNATLPGFAIGTLPPGVSGARLYFDGVNVAATYSAGTGTLTATSTVPAAASPQNVTYTYVDAFNVESTASPALPVTIDRTAPTAGSSAALTISFTVTDDIASVAFVHDDYNPALTDTTPTVTLTVGGLLANDRITLISGGTTIQTITSDGAYTVVNDPNVSGPLHTYSAALTDAAGNFTGLVPVDLNGLGTTGTDFLLRLA